VRASPWSAAPKANIQETVDLIEKAGGKAIAIQADVSKEDEVKVAVDKTVETFVGLDFAFTMPASNALDGRRRYLVQRMASPDQHQPQRCLLRPEAPDSSAAQTGRRLDRQHRFGRGGEGLSGTRSILCHQVRHCGPQRLQLSTMPLRASA
jgi:NAD(P)-dependent dehydrogenase (short-subunit alcohol dehydrogenase family)